MVRGGKVLTADLYTMNSLWYSRSMWGWGTQQLVVASWGEDCSLVVLNW